MPRSSKKTTATILIVILSAAVILGTKFYLESQREAPGKGALARVKGAKGAPIRIIEYIDFECPACAKGAMFLKSYMEEHPGLIYLEMKYYPLRMHRHSFLAATYAECAARQDKFWPVHDLLIERQNQWKQLINAEPAFKIIAEDAELDLNKLQACLEDKSAESAINQDRTEGDALSIKSTPTYFINGQMIVGYNSLSEEITKLADGQKK